MSAGVVLGLFLLGYVISVVGAFEYLSRPEPYLGALFVFWTLAWLGWADGVYVDLWNEVRPAFADDDGVYYAVVHPRLERIYDERRVLVFTVILTAPYYLIVAVMFLKGMPYHGRVANFFTETGVQTHGVQILRVVDFYLLGTVTGLAIATAINGFVNHLGLVSEVSDLHFRNIHASASSLEPIARFTVMSAAAWFVGITPVALWTLTGADTLLMTAVVALLIFVGVVFFLTPQLILHDALLDSKRNEIVKIRNEYEEMHKSAQTETELPEDLSLRLELADRRLETAKSISTWVYDLSSMGKLVAASVTPWLTLLYKIASTVANVGLR